MDATFTSATCTNCGAGKVYTQWLDESLLKTQDPVVSSDALQGASISISRDGSVMVVGAIGDHAGSGSESIANGFFLHADTAVTILAAIGMCSLNLCAFVRLACAAVQDCRPMYAL
jgi:hypothetical protein